MANGMTDTSKPMCCAPGDIKNSGCPWTYKLTPERMLLPGQQA